jgi:prepilin-type N-terminal cleavage/methylation domain-containing protein
MLEYWNTGIGRAVGSTAGRRSAVPPCAWINHSIIPPFHHSKSSRRGFTLVEIVMAITILSVMMLISFFSFDAIVTSWRAGQEMSNTLGQADYVIEQIVAGLRSSYYPDLGKQDYKYGFQLTDAGEEVSARDSISWVKMGPALVGEECGFSESPHRKGTCPARLAH